MSMFGNINGKFSLGIINRESRLRRDFKPYHWVFLVISIFGLFLNNGCYKFEGTQTVPSYLRIDTILLSTYYPDEGSNSLNITDVWVYVNDNIVGIYELPAIFPVLGEGVKTLDIRPGIKVNGISSTRAPYPFYEPIRYEEFNFYPDSVIYLKSPKTEYHPNLIFAWLEDFEDTGNSLDETSASDTVIERTEPENNPDAFISQNSKYSGAIYLTEERPIYSAATYNSFPMPKQGSPVLMEMDYKTNNYFNTGLLIRETSGYIKVPLLILKHSATWNKIYINLGPNLSLHPQATEFRVYFEAGLDTDRTSSTIYLDNLKIINRPN